MADTEPVISGADGNEVFQAKYIPKQKELLASDHPSQKVFISTYPPLGQAIQISKNTSVFTAVLKVDDDAVSKPWQVSLLIRGLGEEDKEHEYPMDRIEQTSSQPWSLYTPQIPSKGASQHLYFTASPVIPDGVGPTTYNVNFRSGPDEPWVGVLGHQGSNYGVLVTDTPIQETGSKTLAHYVSDLNSALKVVEHRSQSPSTTLWSVEASIEAADGEKSRIKDIKFGLPWGAGRFKLSR